MQHLTSRMSGLNELSPPSSSWPTSSPCYASPRRRWSNGRRERLPQRHGLSLTGPTIMSYHKSTAVRHRCVWPAPPWPQASRRGRRGDAYRSVGGYGSPSKRSSRLVATFAVNDAGKDGWQLIESFEGISDKRVVRYLIIGRPKVGGPWVPRRRQATWNRASEKQSLSAGRSGINRTFLLARRWSEGDGGNLAHLRSCRGGWRLWDAYRNGVVMTPPPVPPDVLAAVQAY